MSEIKMKDVFISILIITTGRHTLYSLIKKLVDQICIYPFEIILIADNDSIDEDLLVKIQKNKKIEDDKIKISYEEKGKGFPYYRNVGIKHSKGNIVIFVDDDEEPIYESWIERLILPIIENGEFAVTSGYYIPLGQGYMADAITYLGFPCGGYVGFKTMWSVDNKGYTYHICTGNCAFQKSLFEKIGLFNMNLLHGTEDDEISERIINSGFKIKYVEDATIFHSPRSGIINFMKWNIKRGKSVYEFKKIKKLKRKQVTGRLLSSIKILKKSLGTRYFPAVLVFSFLRYFFQMIGYFEFYYKDLKLDANKLNKYANKLDANKLNKYANKLDANSKRKEYRKAIAISAFIGTENIGDEAIFISMIFAITKKFKDLQYYIFSLNIKKTENLINRYGLKLDFELIPTHNLIKSIKIISQCDIFICGGGGLLEDYTSVFSIPYHTWKVLVAKLFRKKIMFYAVSIGPIDTWIGKVLSRLALNSADIITLRDQKSKDILLSMGINNDKIEITMDPAYNFSYNIKNNLKIDHIDHIGHIDHIDHRKNVLIGICLRPWFDTHRYIPVKIVRKFKITNNKEKYDNFIQKISIVLDNIIDIGYDIKFISLWSERDDLVHKDIINNMKRKDRINVANSIFPDDIEKEIKNIDILIGMRLHSLIFASSLNIPFIAINYTSKVKNFFEMLKIDNNLMIDPESFTNDELIHKIKYLTENYDNIKTHLKNINSELMNLENKNIESLEKLIK